jgi:hypothetical protein
MVLQWRRQVGRWWTPKINVSTIPVVLLAVVVVLEISFRLGWQQFFHRATKEQLQYVPSPTFDVVVIRHTSEHVPSSTRPLPDEHLDQFSVSRPDGGEQRDLSPQVYGSDCRGVKSEEEPRHLELSLPTSIVKRDAPVPVRRCHATRMSAMQDAAHINVTPSGREMERKLALLGNHRRAARVDSQ